MEPRLITSPAELQALVGHEVAVSDWHTLNQPQIDQFAQATGDDQWIHVRPDLAQSESPYGATIAHGFLTLSLLSELSREAFEIAFGGRMRINYGLNRVRFPAPVPAGTRVRARFLLQSVSEFEGGFQTVWQCTVELEGTEKPACVAEWILRNYF